MALSSAIKPDTIIGTKNTNLLSAKNFISGGSSVGAGVLGSAANKIVNFQRAGVQPSPVDISSIVKTISTGVVSNFNNQAQTINNSVTNIISKSIGNFSKDYQDRVKKVDEAKPTGVLQKILGLYKDVIGFIQFFGKRKFVEGLRDNLKALQTSFSESFEVAKLIRQVIIKIVKQLSNLPKTSPSGGGGINLDVDVPGGGLKKSAPRGLNRRMGKGGMFALGAGALGLGAAGAAATNALSDSDAIQPGSPAPEIPGNLLDGLSAIIDRFASAIDRLVKGSSSKKKSESSSRSGDGSAGNVKKSKETPGDTPGASPGATPGENYGSAGAQAVKNFAATQGYSPEFTSGLLSTIDKESGFNPYAIGDGGNSYGLFQFNTGRREPFLKFLEQAGIKKPQELFTNPNSDRAKKEKDKVFNLTLEYMMQREEGTQIVRDLSKSKDLRTIMGGFEDIERYSDSQTRLPRGQRNNPKYNERLRTAEGYLKSGVSGIPVPKKGVDGPQAVAQATQAQAVAQATQTQAVAQQQQIRTIAQPPPQQQPQTNIIPIDMSGGGQQQTQSSGGGGGGISAPPPSRQSGPTAPFLSSSNPDNFLVLYSRMIYNLVDG